MPVKSGWKKLERSIARWWQHGVVAGGIVGIIWAGLSWAGPVTETDPLPLAGQKRVAQLSQEFQDYVRKNDGVQNKLSRGIVSNSVDTCRWALDDAERALRTHPNDVDALRRKAKANKCIDKSLDLLTGQ
jgi:hypothetical protein